MRRPPPSEIACAICRAHGTGLHAVALDLDVTATPPEHVCRVCRRKPRCPSCRERANRLTLVPYVGLRCGRCVRALERYERAERQRPCAACRRTFDMLRLNERDECTDCGLNRLYREYPIVRQHPAS